MIVEVTSPFHDKFNTSRMYNVGEVVEFDDERAQDMFRRNLAKPHVKAEQPVLRTAEQKQVVKKPRKRKTE